MNSNSVSVAWLRLLSAGLAIDQFYGISLYDLMLLRLASGAHQSLVYPRSTELPGPDGP